MLNGFISWGDLSAAFDIVDHDLLMLRPERQFGIHGVALQWFRSYLLGRSYRVIYGGSMSAMVYVVCSVPQGSVLGPRLFIMYTADLSEVVKKRCKHSRIREQHTIVLYRHCLRTETVATVERLERCLLDVSHWMSANRITLNPDKTKLLWSGSTYSQSLLGSSCLSLQLDSDTIIASDNVRVLGVTFSCDLSLD